MTPSSNQAGMAINVGAFILIVGVNLFSPKPLESIRPKFDDDSPKALTTFGTVQCREWEDPIESVRAFFHIAANARKSVPSDSNNLTGAPSTASSNESPKTDARTSSTTSSEGVEPTPSPTAQSKRIVESAAAAAFLPTKLNEVSHSLFNKDLETASKSGQKTVFLPIFVKGSAYPERREMRLRSRYAIQAALTSSGYRSVRSNELYYFERCNHESSYPFAVELFTRDPAISSEDWGKSDVYDIVIVAWLDDDFFSVNHLTGNSESGVKDLLRIQSVQTHIIHLAGSDVLAKLITEQVTNSFKIWFPRSTASFDRVIALAKAANPDVTQAELEQALSVIKRPALNDDRLLSAVSDHLKNFIPGFHPQRDTALVAEWDTGYSRGMVEAWRSLDSNTHSDPDSLRVFPFLRGLDGDSTARTAPPPLENALMALRKLPSAIQTQEQSTDTTQFDYLRRLAALLAQGGGPGGFRPRAIGIIGSDIYDKITVLQAMKPLLPEAVFFTTDADQLLLHPSTKGAAKNLIVASMNDMTPVLENSSTAQATQKAFGNLVLPTFRDSYQFELLNAVKQAIAVDPESFVENQESKPVVFEVGNNLFHTVSTVRDNCSAYLIGPLGTAIGRFMSGMILVILIIVFARHSWKTKKFRESRLFVQKVVIVSSAIVAALGLASEISSYEKLNAHLDGVSALGSLLFLIGSYLTCYFGIRSVHKGMTRGQLGKHTFQAAKYAMLKFLGNKGPLARYLIDCRWLYVKEPGVDFSKAKHPQGAANRFGGKLTSLVLIFSAAYMAIFILVAFTVVSATHRWQPLMGSAFTQGTGVMAETVLALLLAPLFVWLVFSILAWHVIVGRSANYYKNKLVRKNFNYAPGTWIEGEQEHHRLLQLNELFAAIRLQVWFPVTALFLFALSRAPTFQSAWWASGLFFVLLILVTLLFALPVWAGVAVRSYRDEILWHVRMYELRGLNVSSVRKPNPAAPMTCPNWELLRARKRRTLESPKPSPSWVKNVSELNSGALEPWFSQPVVQSIVTLIAGLSAIKALDPLVQFLRGS